jgi:hypothetical protein
VGFNKEAILDPTGNAELATDSTLAPRLPTLQGKTLALVNNGKPNGSVLLEEIGRYLEHHYGVADAILYTKSYFGTPVETTQIEEIAATCDFAVAAIGD